MTESMRERLERDEEQRQAPWAMRSAEAVRRYRSDDSGRAMNYRTRFQRDRDRIVYSRAFRRLRQKAQTGILPEYEDHRRNRLTHTLEVTQLARTIGRALRLNEDLVEAIALGHDLGQPPFGPAGRRALDDLLAGRLDGRGGAGLGDIGGFRRALQSLAVVDRIEKRYTHPGLNLTHSVREGIAKSDGKGGAGAEEDSGILPGLAPSFEAQVVIVADRIAETLHDLDDALQSGTIDIARVERLEALKALRRKLGRAYPARAGRFVKCNTIHRGLVHLLVTGVVTHSQRALTRWAERADVVDRRSFLAARAERIRGAEVTLNPAGQRLLEDLAGFLEARVRRGQLADQVEATGRRVVLGLFAAYSSDPTLLPDHVLLRFKETAGVRFLRDLPREGIEREVAGRYRSDGRYARVLADHLASMTDPFALGEHARLTAMGAVPIPSVEQLRRERRSES